jgi:formamidopyrimidine-DNA glycosylase
MPELPEVETVAADLRDQLVGRRFVSATVLWPRTLAMPQLSEIEGRLAGREVIDVGRRGKYLLMRLDDGQTLIAHLRMTGRLSIVPVDSALLEDKHTRAWFGLAGGEALVFNDSRKFGRIWLAERVEDVTGKLGPEPLAWDLTPEDFAARIRRRKVAIKALLLDQTSVAGVGNIYADESLFRAEIHPLRKASTLTDTEAERLYEALREVLNEAIRKRGTLLRDYRTPYGEDGYFQNHLRVYGKYGRPCPNCGEPIERIRVTQRSTHFCPKCQPERQPSEISRER